MFEHNQPKFPNSLWIMNLSAVGWQTGSILSKIVGLTKHLKV